MSVLGIKVNTLCFLKKINTKNTINYLKVTRYVSLSLNQPLQQIELMTQNTSRFQKHLTQVGDKIAAQELQITERTAKAYRRGERSPKIKQIPSIVKLSGGKISYSCFFE